MLLVVGILTSSPFALHPYPWSRARSVRHNKERNNKVSQAASSFTRRLPGLQIPEVQRRKWKVLLKWHKPATFESACECIGNADPHKSYQRHNYTCSPATKA
jgi:hypothetical protein